MAKQSEITSREKKKEKGAGRDRENTVCSRALGHEQTLKSNRSMPVEHRACTKEKSEMI